MTINNPKLCESNLKIIQEAGKLERYVRDGKLSDLCEALGTIECEAREAGYIINNMVYGK
jgi:hypothetical protein